MTALERIRDGKSKKAIEKIRSAESSKEVSQLKGKLPSVLFSGEFREAVETKSGGISFRNDDSLTKHSGFVVLDFDHVEDPEKKREEVFENKYIVASWLSPSGEGVKALVSIKYPELHADYFERLLEIFPDLDSSGRNVSRVCYESYDPDILIRSSGYQQFNELPTPKKKQKLEPVKISWDVRKVQIPLNMIKFCADGEKHDTLLRASHLMGGYVSGGHIEEEKAVHLLEQEISLRDVDSLSLAKRTIRDGIEEGKTKPIRDLKKLENSSQQYLNRVFYSMSDSEMDVIDLYDKGLKKGYHIGFECAKENYTILLGSTTYIYAAPYSGKSILNFEILINLSMFYGLKHAIFSSEMGEHSHIFAELCQMYAQRDFFNGRGNQMSRTELESAMSFIGKHFYVIDPSDTVISVDDFYNLVGAIEREYNIKIHTTTIDPWNELRHDIRGSRDLYLEDKLGFVRRTARANNWHNFIITHIQKPIPIMKDKQLLLIDGQKYFYPPSKHDLAWGEAWARKGMSMIGVWRPPPHEDRAPFGDVGTYEPNETLLLYQKIKPKGVGRVGKSQLFYDERRHRYYELNSHGEPVYSHKIREDKEAPQMKYLEPEEERSESIEVGDINEQF